jgi:hypothetical protein
LIAHVRPMVFLHVTERYFTEARLTITWSQCTTTAENRGRAIQSLCSLAEFGCFLLGVKVLSLPSSLVLLDFCPLSTTDVKTHKLLQVCKQVVKNLFPSCQQVVFALLVPTSLQQVSNKLLTICNKLDGIIRLGARLFQQVCYSLDITRMLQGWRPNVVTILVYHDCIRLVGATLQQVWQY